jgi:TetR/AcrR family transcriptional regulator, cholesterol catabolism regulator
MKVGVEEGPRSKRAIILRVAAEEFGRHGFDATKWARIAEPAGIGTTALYHYFESKTHCLFTLLQESYEGWYTQWQSCLSTDDDPVSAIKAAVAVTFRLTEAETIKHRLLLHEQGKLSTVHASGRTQQARTEALRLARRTEKMWITYLTDAMAAGAIGDQDPTVLAHAIIGLLQSVWGWYRPGGRRGLSDLEVLYCGYVEAMLNSAGQPPLAPVTPAA